MSEIQAFEGWAVVELFGHQKIAGRCSVVAFGPAQMLRVDVPDLPERDYVLSSPEYVNGRYQPIGTKVRRMPVEGRTRLLGIAAIYAINPCSEAAAMLVVEKLQGAQIKLVDVPPALGAPTEPSQFPDDDDNPDEGVPVTNGTSSCGAMFDDDEEGL